MKKYKLIINVLLMFIFIISVVAFGLIIPSAIDNFDNYNRGLEFLPLSDPQMVWLNAARLETLFSIIFSAFAAIASAVIFFLLNFKIWKEKNN